MNKDLKELLAETQKHCESGNRKALSAVLREIMNQRQRFYRDSITLQEQEAFSNTLYKILLLELDEEENESIETAELAYASLSSLFHAPFTARPEHYKRRLLLLHYFSDYLTDAIIEIFLKKYQASNRLEARNLALECLQKMQLADMLWLDENVPDFIDKDEQVNDACNSLNASANLSPEEQQEAELLHKVLYAYLKAKYKN